MKWKMKWFNVLNYQWDIDPRTIHRSSRVDRNNRPGCRTSRHSRSGKRHDTLDRIDLWGIGSHSERLGNRCDTDTLPWRDRMLWSSPSGTRTSLRSSNRNGLPDRWHCMRHPWIRRCTNIRLDLFQQLIDFSIGNWFDSENTCNVMTRSSVFAMALLLAVLAVESCPAGRLTEQTWPSNGAFALSIRVGAIASMLTGADIGAIVPVTTLGTLILTIVSYVAWEKRNRRMRETKERKRKIKGNTIKEIKRSNNNRRRKSTGCCCW